MPILPGAAFDEPVLPASLDASKDLTAAAIALGNLVQDAIYSKSGLTVGLDGEWGVGKTSIANKVGALLDNLGWVVVGISALSFQSSEKLTAAALADIVRVVKDKKQANRPFGTRWAFQLFRFVEEHSWWGLLAKLAKACELEFSPGIPGLASLKLTLTPGELLAATSFKKSLSYHVAEVKAPGILLVVDDIDRLAPKEVFTFIAALRGLFAVENMCTLILCDRLELTAKLAIGSDMTEQMSHDFLHKLVQRWQVAPVLRDTHPYTETITSAIAVETQKFGYHFDEPGLWLEIIQPLIRTHRERVQLTASLNTAWEHKKGYVDAADLLKIHLLLLKAPAIFRWVHQFYSPAKQGDLEYLVGLIKASKANQNAIATLLAHLFPPLYPCLNQEFKIVYSPATDESDWFRKAVRFEQYFERYFSNPALPTSELSQPMLQKAFVDGPSGFSWMLTGHPEVCAQLIFHLRHAFSHLKSDVRLAWIVHLGMAGGNILHLIPKLASADQLALLRMPLAYRCPSIVLTCLDQITVSLISKADVKRALAQMVTLSDQMPFQEAMAMLSISKKWNLIRTRNTIRQHCLTSGVVGLAVAECLQTSRCDAVANCLRVLEDRNFTISEIYETLPETPSRIRAAFKAYCVGVEKGEIVASGDRISLNGFDSEYFQTPNIQPFWACGKTDKFSQKPRKIRRKLAPPQLIC